MLWLKDPLKWEELSLVEQLKLLRKHYCTGPCGQSSSVFKTRDVTDRALKEAIKILELYDV